MEPKVVERGNPSSSSKENIKHVTNVLSESSGECVEAICSKDQGIFVRSRRRLEPGTQILSCLAASIALEPAFRSTHCAFCVQKPKEVEICTECHMIGYCLSNSDSTSCCLGVTCRESHKQECSALKVIHDNFGPDIDSTHLLTIRLLCAQTNDWWKLLECLYELPLPPSADEGISTICQLLGQEVSSSSFNIADEATYKKTLARVLGCSHAITDVTLPLGNQCLGRAVFLQHSFYNHSCTPNAFLSCSLASRRVGVGDSSTNGQPLLMARVHVLDTIEEGEPITLSYIPLSGLALQERQRLLLEGYGFVCSCQACSQPTLQLPPNVDIDSIREIQYSCNARILEQQETSTPADQDEFESIVSLVRMTQRGIHNQGIPSFHEVSIEVHRLLAMAFDCLSGGNSIIMSKKHHESFLEETAKARRLFDPVALATQNLEYAKNCLLRCDNEESGLQRQKGIQMLQVALGKNHPWVKLLLEQKNTTSSKTTTTQAALLLSQPSKKRKI